MQNRRTGPSLSDRIAEALAPFQGDELSSQEHWAVAKVLEAASTFSKQKAARALRLDVADALKPPEPEDDPLCSVWVPFQVSGRA